MVLINKGSMANQLYWLILCFIAFIYNHTMIFNPVVSEFTLNQQSTQAQTPQLARSRNRYQRVERIYHPQNHVSLHPQEVIIDVSLNNSLNPSESRRKQTENESGIRHHIDSCLNAIEAAYNQKKYRENRLKTQNEPIISDTTIHRIDTNLVLEYIRTICKDYKLRDRFGNTDLATTTPLSQQRQPFYITSPSNNRQRSQSLVAESKRKQYLNLTQTSKIDRRGSSLQKNKNQQPTSPRTHRHSQSAYISPPTKANEIKFANNSHSKAMSGKIQQDFRYCINCQASILSKNVDFHQKHECSNFATLYKLTFSELTALVGDKVQRINRQLKQKLEWLKQKDLSKSRSEQICNRTLQQIQQYANDNTLNTSFEKTNTDYLKLRESLNNEYMEVVKMTHKLHWFNQVYANLKNESSKRRESSRVLDLSCYGPGVSPVLQEPFLQENRFVPASPVSQLYPHLHRKILNPPRP